MIIFVTFCYVGGRGSSALMLRITDDFLFKSTNSTNSTNSHRNFKFNFVYFLILVGIYAYLSTKIVFPEKSHVNIMYILKKHAHNQNIG